METEKMLINSKNIALYDTLAKVDDYLDDFNFRPKDKLHIRLLIEETLGMLKAMTGEYTALLWGEQSDQECRIRLTAKTEMDIDKKKEILSVSKSGSNAFSKGFMGKIADIMENALLNFDNVMALQQQYGGGYVDYASLGVNPSELAFSWSLDQYRIALNDGRADDEAKGEAWDELEKSIVASIAKDVIVGVKKEHVELAIVYELAGK